ncbi:hypothetical protein PHYPSEUDO_006115 [Phytophthora pseudosyringae]|uniref:Uncharacterized protein n=1 Tax=Phytophthora pseudosyringae TaxID=221518 RepID=A0A8T1WFN5_9STRA|nr:hypothetical protein PHYPSEUDO_006115 [Phytophthora pseudosyringae]
MSAFKPERTVLPDCPADFPKLAAITWASDTVASEFECPSALQTHTCEDQESSGTWASGSGSGTFSSTMNEKSSSSESSVTTVSSKSGATPQKSSAAAAVSTTMLSTLFHVFF